MIHRYHLYLFGLAGLLLVLAFPAQAQSISSTSGWSPWQQSSVAYNEMATSTAARYPSNEFGFRYWYSSSDIHYNVGKPKISRLDYKVDNSKLGEAYFRIASRNARYLLKGYLGMGGEQNGNVDDSDYENGTTASDTNSSLGKGRLQHFYMDLGYKLNSLSSHTDATSVIIGGGYFQDVMTARGLTCKQVGTGSFAGGCNSVGQAVESDDVKVLQNNSKFSALRIGLENNWTPTRRLTWRNEIALIPYASFRNDDYHYLRSDLGSEVPNFRDNGTAFGAQMETMFDYRLTPGWSINLGAQYWVFWSPQTTTKVGNPVELGTEKSYDWLYHRLGAFVGTSYHF